MVNRKSIFVIRKSGIGNGGKGQMQISRSGTNPEKTWNRSGNDKMKIHGIVPRWFVLYNLVMARKRSLDIFLEILRQQVPLLAERYGVEKLEVFGSYVRAEQKKDSDLDVLVTFKEAPSLLTFLAIENYLSDLLGVKVDLVMKESLKPKIGEQILREAIPV